MNPRKVGRYELKYELGRGGMSTVFLAHDPVFDRDVAVKVLPREFMHDPKFRSRFIQEAQTIAALEHTAIVPVYDFGEHEGQPYLVMRFMPGGSLDKRLAKGPVSISEAAQVLLRIGSALDHAHERGVIHRDLKPGNILFDQYGDAFLSDFGIAKIAEAGAALTGSAIIGTPAYLSPEQARGESGLDGRSDIYALGTVLFEMLTGETPFQADTPVGLAVKHVTEPVPSILKVKPDLPPDTEPVIARAMAKERDKRFSTASEMAGVLAAVARGEKMPRKSRHPETMAVRPIPPVQSAGSAKGSAEAAQPAGAAGERAVRLPKWAWLGGGLVLVAMAAGVIMQFSGLGAVAEPTSTPTVTLVATATATQTRTATPSLMPTQTSIPTGTATSVPPTRIPATSTVNVPVSTPTPIVVATQAPKCNLDVELVEIRDPYNYWYTNSSPKFTLVLRNNGECAWPEGTQLVLVSENPLNWPEAWPIGSLAVNQTVEVEIQLRAPSGPETLLIAWQLEGPGGELIGSEITRDLRIAQRPTATAVAPTATVSPLPEQPPPPPPPSGATNTPAPPPRPEPTQPTRP